MIDSHHSALTLLLGRQEEHLACENSDELLAAPNHCFYRPDAVPDAQATVSKHCSDYQSCVSYYLVKHCKAGTEQTDPKTI